MFFCHAISTQFSTDYVSLIGQTKEHQFESRVLGLKLTCSLHMKYHVNFEGIRKNYCYLMNKSFHLLLAYLSLVHSQRSFPSPDSAAKWITLPPSSSSKMSALPMPSAAASLSVSRITPTDPGGNSCSLRMTDCC